MNWTEILLLLFIIFLGTAFGAGLYETRIVLPLWFSKDPRGHYSVNFTNIRSIDTGRRFWGMITTLPLTLLTIINVVIAWQSELPCRNMWLAAGAVIFTERMATFGFFIPVAIRLQQGDQTAAEKISGMVSLWIKLNYIRNMLTLTGWILAMKALRLM